MGETAMFCLRVQSSCASGLSGTCWDMDTGLHELCVKRAELVGVVGVWACVLPCDRTGALPAGG
eukprot:1993140-Prymnesium_polylepis.1